MTRVILLLTFVLAACATAQDLPPFPKTDPPTFGILGLVTDETGVPVAGALVELALPRFQRPRKGAEEPSTSVVVTATVADVEGRFIFLGIPAGMPGVTLRVRADDHEGAEQGVPAPERGLVKVEVTIRLRPLDLKAYAQTPRVRQDIFFCTDRKATGSPKPKKFYGPDRGSVACGTAAVEVPTTSLAVKVNVAVGKAVVARSIFAPDSRLAKVEPLPEGEFLQRFQQHGKQGDALVFIHGYNNTFEDAARRLGELAYHLKFAGPVLLYSWPSEGSLRKYMVDENNVEWTEPHLQAVLQTLLQHNGAKKVHLLAHSMGNRALTKVLHAFGGPARFAQVVMAAPDMDRGVFLQKATQAQKAAARISLYGSSHDQPIKLSKQFHGYPRAGEGGRNIAVAGGMDSVDASAARTDILGHDYFTDPRAILRDIELVLQGKVPPPRPKLRKAQHPDGEVWLYQP